MTDEPAPEERPRLARERDERVGRDVEREREARRATCRRTRPRGPRASRTRARGRGCRASRGVSPQRAKTRAICVVGLDVAGLDEGRADRRRPAGGRASRCRLSTDEKPTSAPSAWSAWAMPQAIEWSLATPKMSAVLPSSSPIRSLRACRRRGSLPSARCHRQRPTCARRSAACAAFVLDADGVLVLKGEPLPGAVGGGRARSSARGIPYRVVTNFSLAPPRARSPAGSRRAGLPIDPERIITGDVGRGRAHARRARRPAAVRARRRRRAARVRRPAPR